MPVHHAGERNWDKVRDMLRSLGQPEVESILKEHGAVVINDDLSNLEYRFSAEDIAALFAQPTGASSSTSSSAGQTLH
jgi:molecular chaperone Hsp33